MDNIYLIMSGEYSDTEVKYAVKTEEEAIAICNASYMSQYSRYLKVFRDYSFGDSFQMREYFDENFFITKDTTGHYKRNSPISFDEFKENFHDNYVTDYYSECELKDIIDVIEVKE